VGAAQQAAHEAPDCHTEQGVRLASKGPSGTELVRIEIDVGVEVSDILHPYRDRLSSPDIKT
jgi:peptide subunit release factor 1 (eRF1)